MAEPDRGNATNVRSLGIAVPTLVDGFAKFAEVGGASGRPSNHLREVGTSVTSGREVTGELKTDTGVRREEADLVT